MRYVYFCVMAMLAAGPAFAQTNGSQVLDRIDVTVTGTPTLIVAPNAFRFALSCTNLSTTDAVRWGSATVAANRGQRIRPGASVEIENRAAIYMISEGGNVAMSCTEETR